MRKPISDFLLLVGLAQGTQWVLVTLGLGATVAAIAGGVLAFYASLPWWSVLLSMAGIFMLTAGVASLLVKRFIPNAELSDVLYSGISLRKRLLDDPAPDPADKERVAWQVRFDDWLHDVLAAVERAAEHRLSTFQLDVVILADTHPEQPKWKQNLLTEIELTIERLTVVRGSL